MVFSLCRNGNRGRKLERLHQLKMVSLMARILPRHLAPLHRTHAQKKVPAFRQGYRNSSASMTASTEPTAKLSHLHRTDGSATFSQNGYTVIGAVNGPIEVQRRDELPEEAAVDVVVRPAAGVGGA
jgi:hypothetical protein